MPRLKIPRTKISIQPMDRREELLLMQSDHKIFSGNLKFLREKFNVSLDAVAEHCLTSHTQIFNMEENDLSSPYLISISKVVKYFNKVLVEKRMKQRLKLWNVFHPDMRKMF